MLPTENTPPIAKDFYYKEAQFPINSPPREISFGFKPSELATDKETTLRASNFQITKVSIDGKKRSGESAGITITSSDDLTIKLDLNKAVYQQYRFAMNPVDVTVEFIVEDTDGLTDTGEVAFQVKHAESSTEKKIRGTTRADKIIGSSMSNTIKGKRGDDVINGLSGDDTLKGGNGNDQIEGGEGNDVLIGGRGNDNLRSGPGRDSLKGGAGSDLFIIGTGVNKIKDFKSSEDRVLIEISSIDMILGTSMKDGKLTIDYSLGRLIVTNVDEGQFLDSLLFSEDLA